MVGPIAAAQLFAIICVAGGVALLVVRHATAGPVQRSSETAIEPAPEQEGEGAAETPIDPT
jgi:hypothetical protein